MTILFEAALHDNLNYRMSSIMTIGYIAQEISPSNLSTQDIDQCISVLIENLRFPELEIQRITATALINFINFANKSMNVEVERKFILNGIFESLKSSDVQVRILGMQTLVEISRLYYDCISPHIDELIAVTKYYVK
jgi:hypothetical protein